MERRGDENREMMIQTISSLVYEQWEHLNRDPYLVPVGISARHVHLSREHVAQLFGQGYALTPMKYLSQAGQFACLEQVAVQGPKGIYKKVRILGPERGKSQVEMSVSDCRYLGIEPVVRTSGEIDNTPGIRLKGPCGEVVLTQGVIVADRHIHMTQADAAWFGVSDRDRVNVRVPGPKGGILSHVVIRVGDDSRLDFHIDTDDANAFQLKQGQWLPVRKEMFE